MKQSKGWIWKALKLILPLGLGFYLLWHFYTSMDEVTKDVFFQAIKEANYFWIILSMLLGVLSHLLRAHRWKYLLEPLGYDPKLSHRFYSVMSGYLINLLLPRAGEASRAALLYRSDRVPFSKSFGTIIAERLMDTLTLGLILIVALIIGFDDLIAIKDILVSNSTDAETSRNYWVVTGLIILLSIGVLTFIILWFKNKAFKGKIVGFLSGLFSGVFSIFKSKKPFHFVVYTFLIWGLYISYFWVCFYAFNETKNFPVEGVLIGFIAGTFGIAFTNGGIGAYPYLVGIVVIFYFGKWNPDYGDAEGIGKALGMIIWLSQTVMTIVVGLISLVLLPRNFKKEEHDKVGAD